MFKTRPCTYRLSDKTQEDILQMKRDVESAVMKSISHEQLMREIIECTPLIIQNIQQEKQNNVKSSD